MKKELFSNEITILRDTFRRLLRRRAKTNIIKLIDKTHPADLALLFRYFNQNEQEEIFNDLKCCYGPWDTYIKKDGDWTLDHTIYCLTDVYTYYSTVPDVGPEDYIVVLTGKSVDWDPLEDSLVPDCWVDLDPHSPSN